MAVAPNFGAGILDKVPIKLPIGVLATEAITTSLWLIYVVFIPEKHFDSSAMLTASRLSVNYRIFILICSAKLLNLSQFYGESTARIFDLQFFKLCLWFEAKNMSNTVNKLYKHNAIIYKVILFLITASAIVYLFPKGGQFKYDFTKGKPWQYNNLIAPFDFAIEKTPEEIEEEVKRIDVEAKQYFLYDKNIVQEVKDDYDVRIALAQSNDSLSNEDLETMKLLGHSIISSIYDRGFIEPISQNGFREAKSLLWKKTPK